MKDIRYSAEQLQALAGQLLQQAGCRPDIANVVARVLVEGDLLGHDTHGLAQLPGYLQELTDGKMLGDGAIRVETHQRKTPGPSVVAKWNANRLPGPWVVDQGVQWVSDVAKQFGCATLAISHSHHIACLAAYLEKPARDGLLIELFSSDPGAASVAPHGGTTPVWTPNPIAVGIPSRQFDPILIDVSASITTNAMTNRMASLGLKSPSPWWVDAQGRPSVDPSVTKTTPAGTLLPLGGLDAGHKGYALGLWVEALTAGLSGFGRASSAIPTWGATVLVRCTDPEAMGGLDAMTAQTDHLIQQCLNSPAIDPQKPVRIPGHRGLQLKRDQLQYGVRLHDSILERLLPWIDRFHLVAPPSL